jgi:hypothetical protein
MHFRHGVVENFERKLLSSLLYNMGIYPHFENYKTNPKLITVSGQYLPRFGPIVKLGGQT